jgi:hypothetical protein
MAIDEPGDTYCMVLHWETILMSQVYFSRTAGSLLHKLHYFLLLAHRAGGEQSKEVMHCNCAAC